MLDFAFVQTLPAPPYLRSFFFSHNKASNTSVRFYSCLAVFSPHTHTHTHHPFLSSAWAGHSLIQRKWKKIDLIGSSVPCLWDRQSSQRWRGCSQGSQFGQTFAGAFLSFLFLLLLNFLYQSKGEKWTSRLYLSPDNMRPKGDYPELESQGAQYCLLRACIWNNECFYPGERGAMGFLLFTPPDCSLW